MHKFYTLLVFLFVFCLPTVAQTTVTVFNDGTTRYRIPSIVKLQNGNLMAFCDNRYNNSGDLGSGVADIVARISTDNGATWGAQQTVLKGNSSATDYTYAYGDAATVVDRETGKILLICSAGRQGMNIPMESNPVRFARAEGSADGQTWEHSDISDAIYGLRTDVTQGFVTSGHICQSSRIKVGAYYRLYAAVATFAVGVGAYVIYSDDFGKTWQCLGGSKSAPGAVNGALKSSESKLEELPDGNVLLSCRGGIGSQNGRWYNVYTYTDPKTAAGSWGTLANLSYGSGECSTSDGEVLIVPARDAAGNSVNVLLQSADYPARQGIRVGYKVLRTEADYDAPTDFTTLSDWTFYQVSSTSSCYSTMVLDRNNNIALLYEENSSTNSYDIRFMSVSLATLTGGAYTYDDGAVALPSFTPAGGTYYNDLSVTLTCATAGATLHYTVDNTEPTQDSPVYTAPIPVSQRTTLKAIAVKDGVESEVVTATYVFAVAAPVISPNGGSIAEATRVTLSTESNGATLYYTTDGSVPTTAGRVYNGAFTVDATTTVKAIAVKNGVQSAVSSATFTFVEEQLQENVLPEDGGVYTIHAMFSTSSTPYYIYNNDGTLSVNPTATPSSVAATPGYLWVCSQASDGTYYFSSLDGQGYLGLNDDEMVAYVTDFDSVLKIKSLVKGPVSSGSYTGSAVTGYSIGYTQGSSTAYVNVNSSGEFDRFRITTTAYSGYTTDFVFDKVPYAAGSSGYGTLAAPVHHGAAVTFARSNDSYAVQSGEDYNAYATLNLPFAVSLPAGVTAYKVNVLSQSNGSRVSLTKYLEGGTGVVLPRETPVLLQAAGSRGDGQPSRVICLKPAGHQEPVSTGLAGTLGRRVLTGYDVSTGDAEGLCYILAKKDGHVAFYYLSANSSGAYAIAPNKAFYRLVSAGGAKPDVLTFALDDQTTVLGGVTGQMPAPADEPVYDLSGRRVLRPVRGVCIRGGKKFVVK